MEFAADFFQGKDTVGNYFNPSFWTNIGNEWVLGVEDWYLSELPDGLRIAEWITMDPPADAPVAPAGGRRTIRMRRRNTRKRSPAGRRRKTSKRRY